MVQDFLEVDAATWTLAAESTLATGCRRDAGLPVCLGSFILLIRPTAIIAPT